MNDLSPESLQEEIEKDRRAERRLILQALIALVTVGLLVCVRGMLL